MTAAATPSGPAAPEASPYPRRWAAMFTVLLASFMNLIDITIVNVSLPIVQNDMGASSSQLEWIVAGYILAFALGLLPFGRLGDILGRKRMFLAGVGAFTFASLLCGIAPDIEFLIAARVFQGIAGAAMTPQVLSIAQTIFPPRERGVAFSLFGLSAGLASVVGPLLGGTLIGLDLGGLGWRPIFLINLPIGLFAMWRAHRVLPDIPGHPGLRVDVGGNLIVAAAMFALVFPLVEGRNYGWPLWDFAMMAAALPLFLGFVLWEARQKRNGGPELLPLSLIENRNFVLGASMSVVFFSAMPAFFMVFTLYLQQGQGLTPFWSGLTSSPFPAGVLAASLISGRLGAYRPRERIAAGVTLLFAGMLSVRFAVAGMGADFDPWALTVPLALAGLGLGVSISPMFQTILAGVPVKDAGSGSGALQAIQQAGGALGVAIVSEIYFGRLIDAFGAGAAPAAAFGTAMTTAILYNLGCYVIVALMTFTLRRPHFVPSHGVAAPAPAPTPAE
jgi:EmrB/QacA subfamily drug resistance transporter